MNTTVASELAETFDHKIEDNAAFIASIVTSLFRSLSLTPWTHEQRIENATTINLPTVGRGFCIFIYREATKIIDEVDPAGHVEEMLHHENGDYSVGVGGQTAIFIPSVLWNRNIVWRMDLRGSSMITMRPRIEKRRQSSAGRKASIFRRKSSATGNSLSQENDPAWRKMAIRSAESEPETRREEVSTWQWISIALGRRESKPVVLDERRPLQDNTRNDSAKLDNVLSADEPRSSARKSLDIPQIDIYATKPQTRRLSYHLHTLQFDFQPEVWRQNVHGQEDIRVLAHGDHFTGEEKYGVEYEFVMRCETPKENNTIDQYTVQQWKTVDVVRGPTGKDKTTTTCYERARL
jgi:hypothetical protein